VNQAGHFFGDGPGFGRSDEMVFEGAQMRIAVAGHRRLEQTTEAFGWI
jgi:hypothetical protein